MGCSDPLRPRGPEALVSHRALPAPCLVGAGRFEASVIEERRKGAEDLLRFTVHIPALNNSPQLKEFFRVRVPALPRPRAPGKLPCPSAAPCDSPWLVFLSRRVER